MRRLLLLALLAGCATAHATRLDTSTRPAVSPDSVRVFTNRASVPAPYDEIAIVEAHGYAQNSTDALLRKMREEAGKVGANDLVPRRRLSRARQLDSERVRRWLQRWSGDLHQGKR
jgi:hypothetical protein